MTEQQQEPSPSPLVDQALDGCIEEVKKGFEDCEYEERGLARLRAALCDDFERQIGGENGETRWEEDGPRVRFNCYAVGVTARIAAQVEVADRPTILMKHIGAGLAYVRGHCTLFAPGTEPRPRLRYCDNAQKNWDKYVNGDD